MKSHALGALLCLTGAALAHSGLARAELIVDDGKVAVVPANAPQPARGSLMKTVEKQFGAPADPPSHRGQAAHHPLGLPEFFGVFRG